MGINVDTPVRRVVTTHKSAKSAVLFDNSTELISGFGSNAITVWQNFQYPAELASEDPTGKSHEIYTRGSLIRVVDFPPNSQGHEHRTASLDYGIILEGELELLLEDGSKTTVRAGDVVVQQATMHQWNNNSDKKSRVVFVLLPSEKPIINGEPVGEFGVPEKYLPKA